MNSESEGVGGGLDDEVAAYAAEVRAQLADLPAEDSAELLEDLEDHLREVAAEDAGVLRERLGAPAEYARELRQAAGLPGPGERAGQASTPPVAGWRRFRRSVTTAARGAVRRSEARIRSTDAGRQVLDFLPSLRPAWWVVRAWVLVRALEVWTGDVDAWHQYSLIPRVGSSRLIGLLALLVAIPASVYVGRQRFDGARRRLVTGGEAVLAVFAFGILLTGLTDPDGDYRAPHPIAYTQGWGSVPGLSQNGNPISNLYVYDKNGRLIDGVLVYDQDGRPVTVARPGDTATGGIDGAAWVDATGQLVTNRYPRQLMTEQWSNGDHSIHYVAAPPPTVTPPKGIHQLSGEQPTSQGSTTPDPSPDSPPPSSGSASGTATPATATPAIATPATAPPAGATGAHGSPTPSAPPPTPATPGARG